MFWNRPASASRSCVSTNLVSCTSDEERAWEFGSTVWEVRVPLCKIVFYNDLLPGSIMKGEGEYLVIGGEYRVRQVMCTV